MSTQWRTWFNPSHKLYEPWVRVSWAEHKMATFGLATNIAVHDTAYRFVPDVNHDSQSRGVLTFRCEKVPHPYDGSSLLARRVGVPSPSRARPHCMCVG